MKKQKEDHDLVKAAKDYHRAMSERFGEEHPRTLDAATYVKQLEDIYNV